MSIRPRVRLPTYSDEDDLFAVYSSPFVYELEDFCGRVVDVGGGLLSVEVGLCGEGGRSGCHWSGGVGREGGLCDMEKRFVRVVEQVTNGRAAVADGESRMGRRGCHHRSAGGSDGGTHREGLRDQRIFVSSATPFAAAQLTQPPCPSSSSSSSPPPCSQPASSSASSPSPSSPQPQVSLLRSPPVRRSPTGKGRTLKAISVMGMGLLVGAALTIIIPEYAQYTALHSVADAGICHM